MTPLPAIGTPCAVPMFAQMKVRSSIYSLTAPDLVDPGQKHTVVTIALLGSDAGLFGAARLPMLQDESARGQAMVKPAVK
jgi:hypothetical protein